MLTAEKSPVDVKIDLLAKYTFKSTWGPKVSYSLSYYGKKWCWASSVNDSKDKNYVRQPENYENFDGLL